MADEKSVKKIVLSRAQQHVDVSGHIREYLSGKEISISSEWESTENKKKYYYRLTQLFFFGLLILTALPYFIFHNNEIIQLIGLVLLSVNTILLGIKGIQNKEDKAVLKSAKTVRTG